MGETLVIALVLSCYGVVCLYRLSDTSYGYQYSAQAASWLQGHLDIVARLPEIYPGAPPCSGSSSLDCDVTVVDGRTYLPVPFLPALTTLPFVFLFGLHTYESVLPAVVGSFNLLMFLQVLRRAGCPPQLAPWMLLLFGLGSLQFFAIANGGNWMYSHVLATTFILALLLEAFGRCRGTVLSLLVGLSSLSRPSTIFLLPFCVGCYWASRRPVRQLGRHCLFVLLGLLPIAAIWFWYNWARFGNPFMTGYSTIAVPECIAVSLREHGTFSLYHVPKNVFLMLLKGPEPVAHHPGVDNGAVGALCAVDGGDALASASLTFPWFRPSEWGMSIFLATPALALVFLAPLRNRWVIVYWLTIASMLVVSLTYYSPGWVQFGYTYSLDFLPFMLILVLLGMQRGAVQLFKPLVVLSVVVEVWGIWLMILWPPS